MNAEEAREHWANRFVQQIRGLSRSLFIVKHAKSDNKCSFDRLITTEVPRIPLGGSPEEDEGKDLGSVLKRGL